MSPVGLVIAGSGADVDLDVTDGAPLDHMELEGYDVRCGFVPLDDPAFDPDGEHRDSGLVAVRAFSCNYRDKAFVLRMAIAPGQRGVYVIGSELCGHVLAVGSDVDGLTPGDRVMVDGCFGTEVRPWGLPTNHASRTLQVLPARKLFRVPDAMSDEVAAAFAIGGQTSFSMVRRAGIVPGARVLVTAGTSNTSIFLLQSARLAGGDVSVTTTSGSRAVIEHLEALGASRVFRVEPEGQGFDDDQAIAEYIKDGGGFAAVLDPFCDLYLERSLPVLASFGTYVTCGVERQFPPKSALERALVPRPVLHDNVLGRSLTRNVSVVLNCLGSTEDLDDAMQAYRSGRLQVPLDRVIDGESPGPRGAAAFLSRTFCERGRFGKVVYRYR
jgi:NADPH:quinone reductase-like Zn-dependent oxidoreductase